MATLESRGSKWPASTASPPHRRGSLRRRPVPPRRVGPRRHQRKTRPHAPSSELAPYWRRANGDRPFSPSSGSVNRVTGPSSSVSSPRLDAVARLEGLPNQLVLMKPTLLRQFDIEAEPMAPPDAVEGDHPTLLHGAPRAARQFQWPPQPLAGHVINLLEWSTVDHHGASHLQSRALGDEARPGKTKRALNLVGRSRFFPRLRAAS